MGFPMVYDMTILNEESLVILGPRADIWEGLEVGWAGHFFFLLFEISFPGNSNSI